MFGGSNGLDVGHSIETESRQDRDALGWQFLGLGIGGAPCSKWGSFLLKEQEP